MTFLNNSNNRALSLLELILAVILISLIGFGFTSINIFSKQNVFTAGKRAKLQNSMTLALEHMARSILRAVGDTNNFPLSNTSIGSDTAIEIYMDSDNDGMLNTTVDQRIAYFYNATNHELRYCANYSTCTLSNSEVLAYNITSDLSTGNVTYSNTTNYVTIKLSGRCDPGNSTSPTNPEVGFYTSFQMPSVGIN